MTPQILSQPLPTAPSTSSRKASGSKGSGFVSALTPATSALLPWRHRLIDVGLANINFVNSLALVGAVLYVATQLVRTIVPLRVIGIISIVFFIAYGALAGVPDNVLSVSALAADQHHPPAPDAEPDQESQGFCARRFVYGLASTIHESKLPKR